MSSLFLEKNHWDNLFVHWHFLLHHLGTQNHRMVEFRRTSWDHLVWLPLLDVCQLFRAMSRRISNGGKSAGSLGKLCQCSITNFFYIQTNPLWYHLFPYLFCSSFKYLNKIFWKWKKVRKISQNFWSGSFQTNIKYLFFIVDQHINNCLLHQHCKIFAFRLPIEIHNSEHCRARKP